MGSLLCLCRQVELDVGARTQAGWPQEAVRMQFRMVAAQGHRRGSGSTLRMVTGCAPVLLTGGRDAYRLVRSGGGEHLQ